MSFSRYNIEKSRLIELVRDNPILWDCRLPHYKRSDKQKLNKWNELGREFSVSGERVQRTFTTLREIFRRELNQEKIRGDEFKSKWEYYESMAFLKGVIRERKTRDRSKSPLHISNNNNINNNNSVGIDEYQYFAPNDPNNPNNQEPEHHNKDQQVNLLFNQTLAQVIATALKSQTGDDEAKIPQSTPGCPITGSTPIPKSTTTVGTEQVTRQGQLSKMVNTPSPPSRCSSPSASTLTSRTASVRIPKKRVKDKIDSYQKQAKWDSGQQSHQKLKKAEIVQNSGRQSSPAQSTPLSLCSTGDSDTRDEIISLGSSNTMDLRPGPQKQQLNTGNDYVFGTITTDKQSLMQCRSSTLSINGGQEDDGDVDGDMDVVPEIDIDIDNEMGIDDNGDIDENFSAGSMTMSMSNYQLTSREILHSKFCEYLAVRLNTLNQTAANDLMNKILLLIAEN